MDIFSYFAENHDHLFYLIAGISFIVELSVLGLSGPLLFFAIASVLTGILSSLSLISGWDIEIFCLGVFTGLIALALWKPLKNFQNNQATNNNSSDMVGREVLVSKDVTQHTGAIRYSGIDWNSRLAVGQTEHISAGQMCKIIAIDGNTMLVAKI